MSTKKICILGGSGFVGRYIAEALVERGLDVRVLTRRRERIKHLLVLPTVEIVETNVHDEFALIRLFQGFDAVINLVGVLHDGKGKQGFEASHVDLVRKVINACQNAGVKRLLHMSALNAVPDGPSQYLRSKGKGESMVRGAKGKLNVTIFRPSVIFGPEDNFLNRFAAMVKTFPILPLAAGKTRFQPVFVEDVARVFVDSLDRRETYGKTYDVCGPRVYTLHELIQFTAAVMHKSRTIIDLPPFLSMLEATILEFMPGKPLTRDNLRSMQVDSVSKQDFEAQFGFKPTSLAAVAPTYLANKTPRGRYHYFRYRAGR
ncbi:MAG: complex I NDUFA9 subunit family protein [Pseudomonadota bacterium]